MDEIITQFIAEAHTEALRMGYSGLNEAVVDMRLKVADMGE